MAYHDSFSCSFTGHRPEKLPWGYNERDGRCLELKARLTDALRTLAEDGFRHFICGMAKGCDTYFAEAVVALRDEFDGLTLEAAIPCETQADGWRKPDRDRYEYLLHQCDKITLISREYTPECMLRRNRYMVDSSSILIAAYDGRPGGTTQTINYARSQGLRIVELVIPS